MRIVGITTYLPPMTEQRTLLGTGIRGANLHLYTEAGRLSHPASVQRGLKVIHSAPYLVPAAVGVRSSQIASQAVASLLDGYAGKAGIRSHLHVQCTVDEWIASSPCLKVVNDNFPDLPQTFAVSQLGTAGVPTALGLLSALGADCACISACDVWLAPFVRRVPGLVTYGDAAAAAVVDDGTLGVDAVATVEAVEHACEPPPFDASSPHIEVREAREWLLCSIARVIDALLGRLAPLDRAGIHLMGDGFQAGFADELSCRVGAARLCVREHAELHLGSASPLVAIAELAVWAGQRCQGTLAVVWSASLSGHVAAMLVRVGASAAMRRVGPLTSVRVGDTGFI